MKGFCKKCNGTYDIPQGFCTVCNITESQTKVEKSETKKDFCNECLEDCNPSISMCIKCDHKDSIGYKISKYESHIQSFIDYTPSNIKHLEKLVDGAKQLINLHHADIITDDQFVEISNQIFADVGCLFEVN